MIVKNNKLILKEEDISEKTPLEVLKSNKVTNYFPLEIMERGKIHIEKVIPPEGIETIVLDKNSWYLKLWYKFSMFIIKIKKVKIRPYKMFVIEDETK